MGKKKMKKKTGKIVVAISVVVIILVGVVFLIGEAFVSPSATTVANYYKDNDKNIIAIAIDNSSLATLSAGTTLAAYGNINTDLLKKVEESVSINFTDEDDNTYLSNVIYFDSMGTAMDAMKAIKENVKEADNAVRVRGNALFVGDKECLTLYNNVIF